MALICCLGYYNNIFSLIKMLKDLLLLFYIFMVCFLASFLFYVVFNLELGKLTGHFEIEFICRRPSESTCILSIIFSI
jgi:hypothetical protein